MKACSPELEAHLETGGPFNMADCFTITMLDGTTLRYTSADVDVIVDGNTFVAHDVLISGLKYSLSVGVSVDEQELTIAARDADQINGVPVLVALANGAFDMATIRCDLAFVSEWSIGATTAIGAINVFQGLMSTVDSIGAAQAQVKVKSGTVLLAVDFPRNGYQPACLLTFCGPLCGVSKAAISVTGTATGGDNSTIEWAGATFGLFDQGIVTFSSGENADVVTSIKQSTGNELILVYPLDEPVKAGDTFTACPGCAQTQADCAKWGGKFRGFPFVPPPVTAA